MKQIIFSVGVLLLLAALTGPGRAASATPTQSQTFAPYTPSEQGVVVRTLVQKLAHPWGMAWLPSGEVLITEREGRLRLVAPDFKQVFPPIAGLPETLMVSGQGGLLDVAVHPDYAKNGWIYLSIVEGQSKGASISGTALLRARLNNNRLVDVERLFSMQPKSRGGRHFGGRIVFDRKGYVYLTLGDRGDEDRAQMPNDHAGTVIRLHDDGRVPDDNPFVSRTGVPPEVFSRGNRNIQGAAIHPVTGELWTHEHGPQGGDELNIIRAGKNYGWPTITYGVNYMTGTRIGEGTAKAGFEQPLHIWVPSIAPSGMTFYSGKAFPKWQGSIFLGALRGQALIRLELRGNRVVREERLLSGQVGRIRDVRTGPDGLIYLLTDSPDGALLRLEPKAFTM